jgi:hypothetical protein
MAFPKHNHVIEEFAAKRADPSFRISVFSRRAWSDRELLDTQVLDTHVERSAVDAIAIDGAESRPRSYAPKNRKLLAK